jgi:large subunit ribosomal protein L4
METKLYTMQGTASGSVTLNEDVFACKAHPQTINDVVKSQRNNERQGTVSTKTRGEMAGSTRKLFRQKGTGRARMGDIKSPIQVGGGCAFGPKPKIYDQRPPKKVVDRALKGVLTELAKEDRILVVKDLDFASGKTRDVVALLEGLKIEKALVVLPTLSNESRRAARNLKSVKVVVPMNVNVVDLLKYGHLAISDKAVKLLEEVLVK